MDLSNYVQGHHEANPACDSFGIEAILPIKIEIPSLRIVIEARLPISDSIQDRALMLEGLSENRRLSAQHIETVARLRKVAFDKLQRNNP